MIIDGKRLAKELQDSLRAKVKKLPNTLRLVVVSLSTSPATEQFVGIKKQVGEEIGVEVKVVTPNVSTTDELAAEISEIAKENDGIIVQLPVPEKFDLDTVLDAVPAEQDVDVLGKEPRSAFAEGDSEVLPPVVAAMREILMRNKVEIEGKRAVVVGKGRLVGGPAALWLEQQGAEVEVVGRDTKDLYKLTQNTDIVVLGAGSPGLLRPEMVKKDVIVLDAGSGEVSGRVSGDADPSVSEKSFLFTPTPGGIGPIAVTMIFANLLTLWQGK